MSPARKISVLLAEDNLLVRQGLLTLLESEGHFAIVGQAQNGREAVTLAAALRPDVILMDIAMPVLNGLAATLQILAADPAARVLILSAHSDDAYVERMLAAGAAGFLEKQTCAEILSRAILDVTAGKRFFSPAIARRLAELDRRAGLANAHVHRLTAHETGVLQLVAGGQVNKQVAATLGMSIKTVEKHRQRVMDKLNLHETAGLIRYAIVHGIVASNVRVTVV